MRTGGWRRTYKRLAVGFAAPNRPAWLWFCVWVWFWFCVKPPNKLLDVVVVVVLLLLLMLLLIVLPPKRLPDCCCCAVESAPPKRLGGAFLAPNMVLAC
jgi:hypothetical protein